MPKKIWPSFLSFPTFKPLMKEENSIIQIQIEKMLISEENIGMLTGASF